MTNLEVWLIASVVLLAFVAVLRGIQIALLESRLHDTLKTMSRLEDDVEWWKESYQEMHKLCLDLETEIDTIRDINLGLAERVYKQSELLSGRAEKQQHA